MTDEARPAAYGGPGWTARTSPLRAELGRIWADCGLASEVAPLEVVLLHRPGPELAVQDPDAALMLRRPDALRAAEEHDALAEAYRAAGIAVHYVLPAAMDHPAHHDFGRPSAATLPPNLMFVADLLFMTPEGAILARPASAARAGEERILAACLAALGIPILRSVRGAGVFEGSDALWLDSRTVLLACGLRTNQEGANQVTATLRELGMAVLHTVLPPGTMHLMGQLRFLDRDLAIARRGRLDGAALDGLQLFGYSCVEFPDEAEMDGRFAHNFVTLRPREILMPAGCPITERFYESLGVRCHTVPIPTLTQAAGGIGCLTGVLKRSA